VKNAPFPVLADGKSTGYGAFFYPDGSSNTAALWVLGRFYLWVVRK